LAHGWWAAAGVYRDRRVLSLFFLGFSSGLPFGVLAEPLSAWLSESAVGKTEIGLFALVSIPYSLKFLWAPLVDRLPLPVLTRRLGRRRGWALLAQIVLLAAIVLMGETDPASRLEATAALALLVAFASASQDIVIDAYRVEILEDYQLAAGAATTVFGWRIGQVGAGAAGLILADMLPWSMVFVLVAAMQVVGMATILLNPEPRATRGEAEAAEARAEAFLERRRHLPHALAAALGWIYAAAIVPILEFVRRRNWLVILLFIALYKFGDAVLAVMKVPFFLDVGFTKTEIAEVVKLFGVVAVIGGGLIGGVLLARIGILPGLLVCGILMAASNLVFVAQAYVGPEVPMLAVTIAVENVTTGMGTTAFVAYLSSLCNLAYTATQYALLTSLMAFSRTVLSSGAGWLAEQMTWPDFFLTTTLAAAPGLLLLVWMIRTFPPPQAGEDRAGPEAEQG
jgi:PAT family beta-lactamase induction signal transducer AmpG